MLQKHVEAPISSASTAPVLANLAAQLRLPRSEQMWAPTTTM